MMSKKIFSKKVNESLVNTFNSELVQKLSNEEYEEYITAVASLTLSTLIKNEGHEFVRDFCQGVLNEKGDLPVVQQIKKH
jgi:predicted Zn-dependent peptidase